MGGDGGRAVNQATGVTPHPTLTPPRRAGHQHISTDRPSWVFLFVFSSGVADTGSVGATQGGGGFTV